MAGRVVREGAVMSPWPAGGTTVSYLLERGRLEAIADTDLETAAGTALSRARKRLGTAGAALEGGDVDGAYVAAYDAYRMAAEALLVRQGLRATGGDGSHMTVEDAVAAQFSDRIPGYAKPTFERLRKTGIDDASLTRIHAPVGLELGGRQPAEIAVAILAQILQTRYRTPR